MDGESRSGSGRASRAVTRIVVGEIVLSVGAAVGARVEEAAWDDHERLPSLDVAVLSQAAAGKIDPELDAIEASVAAQKWAAVVEQGWAIESGLILDGRWTAWLQLLDWMYVAARKVHHHTAEAWVLHQRGIRALCLGNIPAARADLARAFRIRQMVGDEPGALATCDALDLVLGPPDSEEAAAPPGSGTPLVGDASSAGGTPQTEVGPASTSPRGQVRSSEAANDRQRSLLVGLIVLFAILAVATATWSFRNLAELLKPVAMLSETSTTTPAATWSVSITPTTLTPSMPSLTPMPSPTPLPTSTLTPLPTPSSTPTVTPTPDTAPPPAPALVGPLANASFSCKPDQSQQAVTLKWKAVSDTSGIDGYGLHLRMNGGDAWTHSYTYLQTSSASLSLSCNEAYFWRVQATDGAGNAGAWSKERMFSLLDVTAPSAPALRAPKKDAQVDCPSGEPVDVSLKWKAVEDPSGIARYEVEVQPAAGQVAASNIPIEQVGGDRSRFSFSSVCGKDYAWRVRAIDNAGNQGEWSSSRRFTVLPAPPDLVVSALEIVGQPIVDVKGQVIVPFRVTVKNLGEVAAEAFEIGLAYTSGARKAVDVTPTGLNTSAPLAPGGAVTVDGKAVLPASLQGSRVSLQAVADAADSVQEISKENNHSTPADLTLPRLVTLTLRPVADACVDSRAPATPFGEAEMLMVGRSGTVGNQLREARSLLRFDLTAIPVGADVWQATLFATLDKQWSEVSAAFRVDVIEVLSAWQESDVRWDSQPEYALFDESSTMFAMIEPGQDGGEWDILELVQAWANTDKQFGLALMPAARAAGEWLTFFSRESDDPTRLVVQYVVRYGEQGTGDGGRGSWAGK
ncbi:MAG: DNRLRE domain-containing protein [Anaerolineae bacterium]|nr:DNRLRE domain-containing protein [Anaerolineae bacterium]